MIDTYLPLDENPDSKPVSKNYVSIFFSCFAIIPRTSKQEVIHCAQPLQAVTIKETMTLSKAT